MGFAETPLHGAVGGAEAAQVRVLRAADGAYSVGVVSMLPSLPEADLIGQGELLTWIG